MTTNKNGYCVHLDDSLKTNGNKNLSQNPITAQFIKDFDDYYSKCFIKKDTNFLFEKLGRNYLKSLPLAKMKIIDSLTLIKAFEYPVFLTNQSSGDKSIFLFMLNIEGEILYYRRVQISD